MTTKVLNQCSCLFKQSGEIVLITDCMTKLLNKYRSSTNNIYQLLESASDCNSSITNEIKSKILAKEQMIEVILKFNRSSMLTLLSFSPAEYLDAWQNPVTNCTAREVLLAPNHRLLLQDHLVQSSATDSNVGTNLNKMKGQIKLLDKENSKKVILFLLLGSETVVQSIH